MNTSPSTPAAARAGLTEPRLTDVALPVADLERSIEVGLLEEVPDFEPMLLTDVMTNVYDDSGELVLEAG